MTEFLLLFLWAKPIEKEVVIMQNSVSYSYQVYGDSKFLFLSRQKVNPTFNYKTSNQLNCFHVCV